jgi:hypothetical protein
VVGCPAGKLLRGTDDANSAEHGEKVVERNKDRSVRPEMLLLLLMPKAIVVQRLSRVFDPLQCCLRLSM